MFPVPLRWKSTASLSLTRRFTLKVIGGCFDRLRLGDARSSRDRLGRREARGERQCEEHSLIGLR